MACWNILWQLHHHVFSDCLLLFIGGHRGARSHRGPRGARSHRGPRGARNLRGPRGARRHRGPRGARSHRGTRGARSHRGPRGARSHRGLTPIKLWNDEKYSNSAYNSLLPMSVYARETRYTHNKGFVSYLRTVAEKCSLLYTHALFQMYKLLYAIYLIMQ